MAGTVGLKDLVAAVAGAIVDAQGLVENHYINLVRRYFDGDGLPLTMGVTLPSPAGAAEKPVVVGVPLLSLVECNMLAIRDMTVELDVELGDLDVPDMPAVPPTGLPQPARDTVRSAGAPIGIPALGPKAAATSAATSTAAATAAEPPTPAAALLAARAPDLAIGVGARQVEGGPTAKLSIRVKARPPSDALLRLVTQLNKMV